MTALWTSAVNLLASLTSDRAAEQRLHTALCHGFVVYGISQLFTHLVVSAPYGRYFSKNWGPRIPAKLGWLIQECPSFLVPAYLWLYHGSPALVSNPVNMTLLGMFMWHYFYRSFVYPLFSRGQSAPLITVFFAILTCAWNGYIQGRYLLYLSQPYPLSWFRDPRFIAGFVCYCTGWYINWDSDLILRNLRKPGETDYKIPMGGMFQYVSAANYFGEILEWCGYALASYNLPSACFAFFVACFIGTRGVQHHKWYLSKFGDKYPRKRKAVIPLVL